MLRIRYRTPWFASPETVVCEPTPTSGRIVGDGDSSAGIPPVKLETGGRQNAKEPEEAVTGTA